MFRQKWCSKTVFRIPEKGKFQTFTTIKFEILLTFGLGNLIFNSGRGKSFLIAREGEKIFGPDYFLFKGDESRGLGSPKIRRFEVIDKPSKRVLFFTIFALLTKIDGLPTARDF